MKVSASEDKPRGYAPGPGLLLSIGSVDLPLKENEGPFLDTSGE
jgi:hypothetical protein